LRDANAKMQPRLAMNDATANFMQRAVNGRRESARRCGAEVSRQRRCGNHSAVAPRVVRAVAAGGRCRAGGVENGAGRRPGRSREGGNEKRRGGSE